jgi:hypothetical protein
MPVDVPIYADGKPTGRCIAVSDPPPARLARGPDRLELRTLEVFRRFGCGGYWEEVRAYVPEGWEPSTSVAAPMRSPARS